MSDKLEFTAELLSRLSVLVVDPNKFTRSITADLLRQLGVGFVRQADDGQIATQAMREMRPHIVVTERDMPDLDGIALTRWIRTDTESPNVKTPVIMITARTTQQEVIAAREAGVTEFIAKPVTGQVLASRLKSVLIEPREFVRSDTYVGPSRRRRQRDDYAGEERRR